jgi:6-phosphogluconolactonase
LDERDRLVVPVLGAKPPADRLTITPPVIEAARKLAVIAAGEDKALMVARAIEGPLAPKMIPAQLARRGCWFVDRAAAARLTARRVAT